MILILSADAIAAALLGALIETLGYDVRFAQPPEAAESSIRRTRPRVCLLDSEDSQTLTDEMLGRAAMRNISVVIFGDREALERVRALALAHDFQTLLMPPELHELEATLKQALRKAG